MTFTHAVTTNNYGPYRFIVDADPSLGTHTTIASAVAAASDGDTIFIRDGTYTEDVVLPPGIHLTAGAAGTEDGPVTIVGKISMTAAGRSTLSHLHLRTNGDYVLEITGSALSRLEIFNCYLSGDDNTLLNSASTVGGSLIFLFECNGDLNTTGIAIFDTDNAGGLRFFYCYFLNNGGSTTASVSNSTAGLQIFYSRFTNNISFTAATVIDFYYSFLGNPVANVTVLDLTATAAGQIHYCLIYGGTAISVTIADITTTLIMTFIDFGNTNASTTSIGASATIRYGRWTKTTGVALGLAGAGTYTPLSVN